VWAAFHADSRRYLTRREPDTALARRVVAIVEGSSAEELQATLESLAATSDVDRVIILNRRGVSIPQTAGKFSVRNIDLCVEEPEALDAEIANFADEAILMIHSGIRVRADAFARMLAALDDPDIDGLQPATEAIGERARKTVLPLGGDPSFTLFEGATYTGGLLVRGEGLKRAGLWRELAVESAFMGLADFCVTRGMDIWPYPLPVFERSDDWTESTARTLPTRVKAFGDCSPVDRYYMLAAGYGAAGYGAGTNEQPGRQRLTALAMIDHGLLPLLRLASWTRRRMRDILPRMPLGPIERRLERLLRGNG
jgi:hypothetical protein